MIITPEELKLYSVFDTVKKREDQLLINDIMEAEIYINAKIEKQLNEHDPLPLGLRLAVLKMSQYYALVNSDESIVRGYKSEKLDDYSYTLGDDPLSKPDILSLLDGYLKEDRGDYKKFSMRVRGL